MSRTRVVVIGGGLGGLATALRLAARGFAVTVCEQGATLGGKMNCWRRHGFSFDTGPSLITMPAVFEELFAAAGEQLQDHLDLVRIQPLAEYHYADGTRLTHSTSLPEWLATLQGIEPRDVDGFWRFLALGSRLFELSNATFLRAPLGARPSRDTLPALRRMPLRHAWGSYHRTVAAHFRSPYLRQLYNRYPTYVGSSPYQSPAMLAVIPYIEYAFGGWSFRGGLYTLVESLSRLAERTGVELRTRARVDRIEQRNGHVSAVAIAGGGQLPTDVVVMNGDASNADRLLGRDPAATLAEEARSLSGVVLLLAIDRTRPDLPHQSVYFSRDYAREFTQLFDERRFPDDPTVYVSAPSRSDRSVVPGEGETLFVMANAPATGTAWGETQIESARQRMLVRLEEGGVHIAASEVVASDVWSPREFQQRYDAPGGAIYGTHSHGWRRAFLRPRNQDARVKGLFYVGGSAHPGGGTPTVLLSAKITSELIARDA